MLHKKWAKLACLALLVSVSQVAADSLLNKTGKGLFHTAQAIGGLFILNMGLNSFQEFSKKPNAGDVLGMVVALCSGCTLEREAVLGFKELFAKKTMAKRVCNKARQVIARVESRCC